MATKSKRGARGKAKAEHDWLLQPHGRVFNNLSFPDTQTARAELARITGESLVATAAACGGKIVVFDGKAQWYAFHATAISEKHPGLGDRDLVAEIIAACARRGMRYVPYIPVDADQRAWREHPQWRVMTVDGKIHPADGSMPRCCHSSPFRRFMGEYLREFARTYDIAGFWFDGLDGAAGSCYCQSCRTAFRREYGLELPTDRQKEWKTWLKWIDHARHSNQAMVNEWRALVDEAKPGLPFITNTWWDNSSETVTGAVAGHEVLWRYAPAIVQYFRELRNGMPPESYLPTSQYGASCSTCTPLQELRARALTSLTHGGTVNFTIGGHVPSIRQVNAELAERAAWTIGAVNVPYCGLVHSALSTRVWDQGPWGDEGRSLAFSSLRILQEEKIPQRFVTDQELATGDLSVHAALLLPDVGYIPEAVADRLRAYVQAGGSLIATYRTSLLDQAGARRQDFALADLLGVHFRGELADKTELPAWNGDIGAGLELPNRVPYKMLHHAKHAIVDDPIIAESHPIEIVPEYLRGKPAGIGLTYPGTIFKVLADAGTDPVLWDQTQEPGQRWPMITSRTYGKGRVVYIAASIESVYAGRFIWPALRRLLANSIRFAVGKKAAPYSVEAPLHVQSMLYRQPAQQRLVLHLLNNPRIVGTPPYNLIEYQSPQEDVIPLRGVTVRLLGRFKRIYLAPSGKTLRVVRQGRYSVVRIPVIHTHIMVVAEA